MFELLINNFKILKNVKNYINLSFFAYCNKPFNYDEYIIRGCLQKDVSNSYIYYCRANFLISIKSNLKNLSLSKILIFNNQEPKFSPEELLKSGHSLKEFEGLEEDRIDTEKSYLSGNKATIKSVNFLLPNELLLLKDNRLLIKFSNILYIYIYGIDENIWKYEPDIVIYVNNIYRQVIQLDNGLLLYLDTHGSLIVIQLFEKTYKIIQKVHSKIYFSLELKNKKILLLSNNGIGKNVFQKNRIKPIQKNFNLKAYNFAYELQDEKIILNKEEIIHFLLKDCKTIVATIYFKGFERYYGYNVVENTEKHIIYLQSTKFVAIINTKTFQIQSIYKEGKVIIKTLKGRINPEAQALMSIMEQNHFQIRKLSLLFLFGLTKIYFFQQISKNKFIIFANKKLYLFQSN